MLTMQALYTALLTLLRTTYLSANHESYKLTVKYSLVMSYVQIDDNIYLTLSHNLSCMRLCFAFQLRITDCYVLDNLNT